MPNSNLLIAWQIPKEIYKKAAEKAEIPAAATVNK